MKRIALLLGALTAITINIWSETLEMLYPAVEEMNLHHRVRARQGGVFGIEICNGDTAVWQRYEANMPVTWPDDMNNSMGVKLSFISVIDGKFNRDSVKTVTIFSDKTKSVDISMKISGNPKNALLQIGDREITSAFPVELSDSTPVFVRFFSDKKAETIRSVVEYEPKADIEASGFESFSQLKDYIARSSDPFEGIWTFYDRATAPLLAAPNGEYVLATVKNEMDYDIIYIKDNEGIPSTWKPFEVKGKLRSSDIPGVYDVLWYDRSRTVVRSRISAVIDGDIFTVSFPYYKTSLRFNRLNKKGK